MLRRLTVIVEGKGGKGKLGAERALAARERTAALVTIAKEVIDRYQAEKERRALLDYEDLIDRTIELKLAAGGVHILGTERHESRRIDNQLRGRSGRQGDPGSSRFYLALDDDLMRLFGREVRARPGGRALHLRAQGVDGGDD